MDPSYLEKVKTLAIQDKEDENSTVIQHALSNTVVLRDIFEFLPASTLKSCNLVNKLWKNECYSHCRDQRKWVAKISQESPCASLRDFNELLSSMMLVPYNGLSLNVDQKKSSYSCQCNSPEDLFTNVLDKLTWRHLNIRIDLLEDKSEKTKPISCAAATLGLSVLEQKIIQLESLELWLDEELQGHFDSNNWKLVLPNLKTICFPKRCWSSFGWKSSSTSFLTRLTYTAPNLQEIRGWIDHEMLQLFPEDKWGCVKDFKYSHHPSGNELKIASRFVSKRPTLRRLSLTLPESYQPTADCTVFDVLLELSEMTMEDLEIRKSVDQYEKVDASLQMPRLPKLRVMRLKMTSGFGQALEMAQLILNQHDGQGFPQLEEFQLSVDTPDEHYYAKRFPSPEIRDLGDYGEISSLKIPIQPFASVWKLGLKLDPATSSFVQIKILFPAVTDLCITCRHGHERPRLPYRQIFRLWQNLETLSICYNYTDSPYNLEAAFCGLDEKEVDFLGKEDDNFLMAVELVPDAPCVLTMQNLQSFTIEYRKICRGVGDQGTYMTRVARMLASRYLPKALVNVSPTPAP